MFKVDQIDHIELFVPGRREAAAWYRKVLGCEVVPECEHWSEDPGGPLMISPDGGNTMMALFHGEPQGPRPTAGFHRLAFRVNGRDFADFVNNASTLDLENDRGETVKSGAFVDHDKALSIYFCDPYGHRLEITTYEHEIGREGIAKAVR